jgi:hypothetical protein
MLVSHAAKFIYTKTVKTAGTSVELYLEPFCVKEAHTNGANRHGHREKVSDVGIVGFRGRDRRTSQVKWWNHMPAADIKALLGDEVWNSYFKFCVVRNPFDKVISLFYYWRKAGRFPFDPSAPDHEQLESWLINNRIPLDRDKYTIDGQFCLDTVIRYERLHQDMERVCQRIGLPWNPAAFPTMKIGFRPQGKTIASLYTERSAKIVRDRFDFEFEFFGYPPGIKAYIAAA